MTYMTSPPIAENYFRVVLSAPNTWVELGVEQYEAVVQWIADRRLGDILRFNDPKTGRETIIPREHIVMIVRDSGPITSPETQP
jgi:hypothetical protein